jgi:hypothetical protein
MPYKVLTEQKAEQYRKQVQHEGIKSIKKLERRRLAKREPRPSSGLTKSFLERNYHSSEQANMLLMDFIKMLYAYCRQKIQDPATPRSQKRAFHKIEKILESHFSAWYLAELNPYMRHARHNLLRDNISKEAYAFCWTPARVQ